MDVTEFGSLGQTAFATIRGSNPDQVLVLLDGVEVNTPTVGQFDFANLTTDNLNRIEILRGGGGALYGSEAIGGVVNVLTQRGEGPFHLLASGEAGSAATHHESLGINGAQGPLALSGTASFLASDGFRSINDDYRNFSTVWRSDLDLLPAGTLRAFLRYSESRTGLVNFNVFENRLDPDAHARDNFFLAKGEWEHAPTDMFNYRTAVSFVRDNPRYRDDRVDEDGDGRTGGDQPYPERTASPPRCRRTVAGPILRSPPSASNTRNNGRSLIKFSAERTTQQDRRRQHDVERQRGRTARSSACTGRSSSAARRHATRRRRHSVRPLRRVR